MRQRRRRSKYINQRKTPEIPIITQGTKDDANSEEIIIFANECHL
jgi:hypothetical protein